MSAEPWQINEPRDLIELVMTQHWDMAACPCTFCEAGRIMGFRPHTGFLFWREQGYDYLKPVPRDRHLNIAPWSDILPMNGNMPPEDQDPLLSDFVEFTIDDLPGALKHLGPVTGGDLLVFRGGDYTEPQRSEITEAVLHYYVEVARNKLPHRIDGKPAWPLPTERVAAHVPLLVFLPEGADVEHLTESDMIRAGWARVPKEEIP